MKVLVVSFLLLLLCTANGIAQGKIEVLKIRQSGCKGTCPVYEITLSKTGLLVYEGIQHTDSIGKYLIQIGAKNARRILSNLEKNKVMTLPESYPIQVADMPMTFFTIKTRTSEKVINRANWGPAFLQKAFDDLNKLSKRYRWKKVVS